LGSCGSFDDRAKKITKAFVRILNRANVSLLFLVLKKVVLVILRKEQEMSSGFKCKR
jgi:hypothetical protein